ncbi:MAG: 50S ribosomal protein L9 [Candidatus Cloacimonadota bacterium]|nr:MAG: 50S ribosomal protein L9 [Candidatus Cloacimonadota bacterium]
MKIILLENIEKLGKEGDVVNVAAGYARNYLLLKKKALISTPGNQKKFVEIKKLKVIQYERSKEEAAKLAEKLNTLSITSVVKAGENEKLYGSVTATNISELLQKEGYEIDKKIIIFEEPIKSLGVYTISIKLHPEVQASIKLWVVSEAV